MDLNDGDRDKLLPAEPRRPRRPPRHLGLLLAILVVFTLCLVILPIWPRGGGRDDDGELRLTPYPATIEDGGDLVIYWEGDLVPHKRDYLTLSCGPQWDVDDVRARKTIHDTDATANSVRFDDLYMMRCNYTVQYFHYRHHTRRFELVANVSVGMRESFNTPKHGHLALTTDPRAMAIMFNTASNRTIPEAKYGLRPEFLTQRVRGHSTTYNATDMCEAPATTVGQELFRDPGYMHTVIMTGLEPDRYYYYQYGNDIDGWSEVRSFRSRPTPATKAVKFIAYADMGVDPAPAAHSTATRVFADVVGGGYDSFLLHVGDISYARGDGAVWDKFFHIIEPFATRIPYMVSIGNHEHDYLTGGSHDPSGHSGSGDFHPYWGNYGSDSLGECSVPMYHRWHVPATGNSLFWYSFNYGGIHVIQLSSEHNWTRGSTQYLWLERDLEAVNRVVTPWIIVTAHRMMYSTQNGLEKDMRVGEHMRDELEGLILKHKVNLVLAGHQHSYERTCAVYRGECVRDGKSAPVHMIVGAAGFDLSTEGFSDKYGRWSLAHIQDYGHIRVETTAANMSIEFVLNRNGDVADRVVLTPY